MAHGIEFAFFDPSPEAATRFGVRVGSGTVITVEVSLYPRGKTCRRTLAQATHDGVTYRREYDFDDAAESDQDILAQSAMKHYMHVMEARRSTKE